MGNDSNRRTSMRWAGGLTGFCRVAPILLVATLALSVCSCGTTPIVVQKPDPALAYLMRTDPQVEADLLAACPDLPLAPDGKVPTLVRNHEQVARLYNDCKARHGDLIKAVEKREAQEAARLEKARQLEQQQQR